MHALTGTVADCNALAMRSSATLAPLAAPVLGIPAAAPGVLPAWALLALLAAAALLTAVQFAVTQIIRLRASNQIANSRDALRVLEIEDLPHHRPRRNQ